MILEKVYDELMAQIEDLKKAVAGGSGGRTKDYDKLDNRPKVNNITLSGNKKSSDLKIAYSMTEDEYAAASKNAESIYCLQANASTLTDSAYVNLEVADWTEESGVYKQTHPFVFEITPAPGWSVEDVSIETGFASVDSYEVTSNPLGLSITYAAETLPEYGITATVTVTVSQPIGVTRIVKDGVEFGKTPMSIYDFSNKNEIAVGKWVDGKTIYRKVFDITVELTGGSNWIDLVTATGMTKVIDGLAVGVDRYAGNVPGSTRGFLMRINNGKVQILIGDPWQFTVDEFILYYTK